MCMCVCVRERERERELTSGSLYGCDADKRRRVSGHAHEQEVMPNKSGDRVAVARDHFWRPLLRGSLVGSLLQCETVEAHELDLKLELCVRRHQIKPPPVSVSGRRRDVEKHLFAQLHAHDALIPACRSCVSILYQ